MSFLKDAGIFFWVIYGKFKKMMQETSQEFMFGNGSAIDS